MSPTIMRVLTAAGWKEEPPRNAAEASFIYRGGAARALIVEVHGADLWIWIEADHDRRVLSMTPGDALSQALDAIVARQATLSVATYLQDYFAFSAIGRTSIVAWEQFEPQR